MIRRFMRRLPGGIELSCRAAGDDGPRVMLLHGFPEAAFVWDPLLQALAGDARLIAPNLRGYERSAAPVDVQAYKARHLVGDLVALIEGEGAPVDLLVAHDWGGAIAWALAAQRPELMRRLLIVNAPHPATFLRELREDPAQQAASAYMNFLVRPDAEARLAENDFARLWPFLRSPWWTPTDAERVAYREVWRMGLTGALNYYRASPLRPQTAGDDTLRRIELDDASVRVTVPTTVLWGEGDVALRPSLLDGLERHVPQLQVRRVPDAGHWIVHERPGLVLQTVRNLLAG